MLVRGDPIAHAAPLVRVHSGCLTGEVLGSLRCDCADQLTSAMRQIANEACGAIVYLPADEGRGIGLANKIAAYGLQDNGVDTVDANVLLGLPADARDYRLAASILLALPIRSLRLLSNNPRKAGALIAAGITVVSRIPCHGRRTKHNASYLDAKRSRLGHDLGATEVGTSNLYPNGT